MGVGTQEDADDDLKCRNSDDFDESDDDDEGLRCPISRCVFKDPVMIVGSGNTYERKCIETFFEKLRRNGQVLRDPLTNEPLSSSNNSSQKSERVNHELGATTSGAEIFRKITSRQGAERMGDERGAESERTDRGRKEEKDGKSRDFFRTVGRDWTMDGDSRAFNGSRVFSRARVSFGFVFRGNPVWAAAGKNGRRGDGEEFNGGLLRALFGFGKNARGGMKERKRMEMINEAFDSS